MHLTEHPRGIALARRLKPRWAVTSERATERGAAWLWKRHYTHFYRFNLEYIGRCPIDEEEVSAPRAP